MTTVDVFTYAEVAELLDPDVREAIEAALGWVQGGHGTVAGFQHHLRRGEIPCRPCLDARRVSVQRMMGVSTHGGLTTTYVKTAY